MIKSILLMILGAVVGTVLMIIVAALVTDSGETLPEDKEEDAEDNLGEDEDV